jgi:hypothetical protein
MEHGRSKQLTALLLKMVHQVTRETLNNKTT